jgi:DNA topoisomerase IB
VVEAGFPLGRKHEVEVEAGRLTIQAVGDRRSRSTSMISSRRFAGWSGTRPGSAKEDRAVTEGQRREMKYRGAYV